MNSSVEQTMKGTSKFVEHIHIMDLQPVQVSESVNNTPPVLDVSAEMSKPYVQSCRNVFPEEDVKTGIRYLNTLGGISRHRNHRNLSNAILHVRRMKDMRRINTLGLPGDFSRESLIDILVETRNNELDDVIHAINQCLSEADGDKSDFHYPIRRYMRRPSQRLSLKDGEDSNIQSEIWYPARTIRTFMEPPTLQSRSLSFGDILIRYRKIPQPFKANVEDSNIESDMRHPVRITRPLRKPPTLQIRPLSLSGIENKSAMEKRQSFTADGEDSNIETDLRRNGILSYRWSGIHSLSSFISSDKDENKSVLEKRQYLKVDILPDLEIQPPRPREVTLDSRWKDFILTLMPVPKSFVYDQQSVMMEKKKKGKANGKTYKQKYVTVVFKSEKRLSDDRLLKLRNENDIRIMKIQEKFERIIAQLDAKIQHGKRKRQHAPI